MKFLEQPPLPYGSGFAVGMLIMIPLWAGLLIMVPTWVFVGLFSICVMYAAIMISTRLQSWCYGWLVRSEAR